MIYVTENGVSEKMACTELCDEWRIHYHKDYINEMLKGEIALISQSPVWIYSLLLCLIFSKCLLSLVPFSNQRWRQREGLHCLVPAG